MDVTKDTATTELLDKETLIEVTKGVNIVSEDAERRGNNDTFEEESVLRSNVEAFKEAPGTTLPPLVNEILKDDLMDTANDQVTMVLQNSKGQLASELDENKK